MHTTHTHFVATVIHRCNENDEIEFLVIDYRSTDPRTGQKTSVQTKFPGGTNKESPRESVTETRNREVLEETGLILLSSREIWRKEISSDHTKYAFRSNFVGCLGKIRSEAMVDDGDELSVPYWVSANDLCRILFHTHQPMYMAAMRDLGLF